MMHKLSLLGPGRFQWNRGGWFGSQLGGTAWMLVGAIGLVPHAPELTILWLACFAVANVIGVWMWRRRDRLQPYPAMQALLLVCGVSGLTALAALHLLRPGLRITQPAGIRLADEPELSASLLLLVVLLMTCFHLLERKTRESSRSESGRLP